MRLIEHQYIRFVQRDRQCETVQTAENPRLHLRIGIRGPRQLSADARPRRSQAQQQVAMRIEIVFQYRPAMFMSGGQRLLFAGDGIQELQLPAAANAHPPGERLAEAFGVDQKKETFVSGIAQLIKQ